MSIFDIFKNKNKGPSSESQFYAECVKAYHDIAKKHGFVKKGVVLIPELIPIGNKTVLGYLKDTSFQEQFDNPQMWYYAIMTLAIQAGMVLADKWHSNFSGLDSQFIDQIIENGPEEDCKPLLKQIGLTDDEKENDFYFEIFEKWVEKHEPYWKMSDCRIYTLHAMLAAYQLGVSMILSDYGY